MKLTWHGTATIMLEHNGTRLLFDPFFPLNDSVSSSEIEALSSADNILVTHGHFDHIAGIPAIMSRGNGKPTVHCTAAPRDTLISKGIAKKFINTIAPGDSLELGAFKMQALKGKHIAFNAGLVMRTLLNPRILKYRKNLPYLLKENKLCVEAGETVVYDISASGLRALLMGSLNLDDDTDYPQGADLLILPFQGRSDLCEYAMRFIERLKPRKILLTHFDDAFPPISGAVRTGPFIALMQEKCPAVPVICPRKGVANEIMSEN